MTKKQQNEEKKTAQSDEWKKRLSKFVVEEIGLRAEIGLFIPQIKQFIESLLSQKDKEWREKIEKLPTGMFDSTPYKEALLKPTK